MGKNGARQVEFREVDYDNCDDEMFMMMEDLYLNHHSTPKEFLQSKLPYANYLLIFEKREGSKLAPLIGMTSYRDISKRLAMTERTILYPNHRGKGYGRAVSWELERFLKAKGFNKMCCEVFTFNKAMIKIKIDQDFLIEGLMRNHDGKGLHQYYLGKEI